MPHEVEKMEKLIVSSKAQNVIFLSGDRHISEFAKKQVTGLNYPLIEFTASGMTHALGRENKEPNKYRVGHNVVENNFGIIRFDFNKQQVTMEIRGENNKVLHNWMYSNH